MYRWEKKIGGGWREKDWGHSNPRYFIFRVFIPALVICIVLRHLSWVSGWLRAVGERVWVFTFWCSSSTPVFQQNWNWMFPCAHALNYCVHACCPDSLTVPLWLALISPIQAKEKVVHKTLLWTDKRRETWLTVVGYWKYLRSRNFPSNGLCRVQETLWVLCIVLVFITRVYLLGYPQVFVQPPSPFFTSFSVSKRLHICCRLWQLWILHAFESTQGSWDAWVGAERWPWCTSWAATNYLLLTPTLVTRLIIKV